MFSTSIFVTALMALSFSVRAFASETEVIGVCELAQKLKAFRDKTVAVRGEFFTGQHGATVGRERCPSPSPFKEFGSGFAINLAFPEEDPSLGRELDRDSLKRLEEVKRQLQRNRSDVSVTATFVGVLQVRSGFKLKKLPSGGYSGNGFGHLGTYPAQIVMSRIENITAAGATR
jgi:hypothetical protein